MSDQYAEHTLLKSIIVEYTNHGGAEDQDHV
jgi:hypothetical protein